MTKLRQWFTMFMPLGQDEKRKCLSTAHCIIASFSIGHDARQLRHLRNPTAIDFLSDLDFVHNAIIYHFLTYGSADRLN